ncbi:MAG: hypothetical protein JW759_09680 [Candidatus Coatesbacteria bacterium]|nr:hypothetical protein [Candidatus Coatesbacteria bacterium]
MGRASSLPFPARGLPNGFADDHSVDKMKVYFAGVDNNLFDSVFAGANVLLSFASLGASRLASLPTGRFSSVMLDSGAFSAFRSGRTIDVLEYSKFIGRNLDNIDLYVNLDVIGDAEASLANLRFMESRDLAPIPVFHYGEDLDVLRWMREKYCLIGLGGMVPRSRRRMFEWLSTVFNKLPHKYHGFGIGDASLISAFPFHSIDNTTWKRIVQQPVLKTKTNSGVNWAEHLTRKELFTISRSFYERLCASY